MPLPSRPTFATGLPGSPTAPTSVCDAGGQFGGRGQHDGVGVAAAQVVHGAERRREQVEQVVRPGHEVCDRKVLDRDGRVLEAQQVLQRRLDGVEDQGAAVARLVQGGDDEPVTQVEVCLPVDGVVLVAPRHVPDRNAGHGDRRIAGRAGAQAVLDVVPLDEQRQRLPEPFGDLTRDQAHPPAVEVDVDAPVQQLRVVPVRERVFGEIVVVLDVAAPKST